MIFEISYILENLSDPFNLKIMIIVGKGNNGSDGIITHHYYLNFIILWVY